LEAARCPIGDLPADSAFQSPGKATPPGQHIRLKRRFVRFQDGTGPFPEAKEGGASATKKPAGMNGRRD